MEPDLVAAPLGMNDVIGSGDLTGQVRSDLDGIYGRLTDSGATVIVSTYPDVTRTIPLGHRLEGRLQTINALMREFAHRYGLVLVDLHSAPVLTDLRAWSTDRLHASSLGHQRLADGAAHALGLPGRPRPGVIRCPTFRICIRWRGSCATCDGRSSSSPRGRSAGSAGLAGRRPQPEATGIDARRRPSPLLTTISLVFAPVSGTNTRLITVERSPDRVRRAIPA